jgi:hypothetical protein
MNGKVIALFATLAFILVLVGSTDVVTLFGGSHQIINITSSGNDIDCVPCHQWVRNELDNATYHSWMVCEDCHRYEGARIEFAEHNLAGKQAHAAYTPRCLDCHNNDSITLANGTIVFIKKADAFGDPDYGNDSSAHKKFVKDSLNSTLSVGENEACIACHTNYSLEIVYSYFWNIEYELFHWNVPFATFSYNVTQREYTNTFSKTGAKHEFIDTTDINCISCHKNIYVALVNGTDGGSNEDYLTHAPIEINTIGGSGTLWNTDNPWDDHYRYHYIPAPATNRAAGVNSSYCFECHNVKKYADENPSNNTTYNLTGVTADTNSAQVHAAEALSCQTCHGSGKTKVVIDNPDFTGGAGHSDSNNFVDDVASNYARTFHGDICMGCHEAAVHPSAGTCSRCHKDIGGMYGSADVNIESEPSGYATNTNP